MRIVLTGASGFIGSALAEALRQRGHEVLRAGRSAAADLRMDFSEVPSRQWWRERLAGVDAVVNTVGIIREQGGQTFDALHRRAPIELFHGCAAAGVERVVHISALGADAQAQSRYHLTKRAADDELRTLPLRAAIVQPSLVYGSGGSSAALFNSLALAPLLMLPRRGGMLVQPVHVRDVVEGIVALLEAPPAQTVTLPFAGPQAMTMRDYLARLRHLLGAASPLRVWGLPESLFRFGAKLAGRVPGSVLDEETAGMLVRGNHTSDNALPALLHRPPTPVQRFIARDELEGARTQAVLAWWRPALKAAVGLVWIWTGIVSLGLYPLEESRGLLARVGLHGRLADLALYGAAALDLALGVLTWVAPRGWRRGVWAAQVALILGYMVLITLFLPEYWLHPYGPLTKNLPMLAAIGLLWSLEPPKWHGVV